MPEPITPPTAVPIVVHLDVETDTFAIHVGTATGLPEAYAATLGVGLLRAAASESDVPSAALSCAERDRVWPPPLARWPRWPAGR